MIIIITYNVCNIYTPPGRRRRRGSLPRRGEGGEKDKSEGASSFGVRSRSFLKCCKYPSDFGDSGSICLSLNISTRFRVAIANPSFGGSTYQLSFQKLYRPTSILSPVISRYNNTARLTAQCSGLITLIWTVVVD